MTCRKAKEIKGRETFLSVSDLSCDVCSVIVSLDIEKDFPKKETRRNSESEQKIQLLNDYVLLYVSRVQVSSHYCVGNAFLNKSFNLTQSQK